MMIVYSSISNPNLAASPVTMRRMDNDGIILARDILKLLKKISTVTNMSVEPAANDKNQLPFTVPAKKLL